MKPLMDKTRTTNFLLLIIVIPIVFYLLKILSFIFIPLFFSMFVALLFLPLMRYLKRRGVHISGNKTRNRGRKIISQTNC